MGGIALASIGSLGFVANAWSASASFTCLGTSVTTNCSPSGQNNPSFLVGSTIFDTAVIKDPSGIYGECDTPTTSGCVSGNVTFAIYQGSSCSGTLVDTSGKIALSGTQYPGIVTYSEKLRTAGYYSFLARYEGNYNDNNGWLALQCEPLTITLANPTITTTLSSSTIQAGSSAYDASKISGGNNPTGTVQYEYFSGSSCTGSPTLVGSAVTISSGNVPDSAAVKFSTAGSYSFAALYSGDSNNNPSLSICEPLAVSDPSTSVTTTTSTSSTGSSPSLVHDTSTTTQVTKSSTDTTSSGVDSSVAPLFPWSTLLYIIIAMGVFGGIGIYLGYTKRFRFFRRK